MNDIVSHNYRSLIDQKVKHIEDLRGQITYFTTGPGLNATEVQLSVLRDQIAENEVILEDMRHVEAGGQSRLH